MHAQDQITKSAKANEKKASHCFLDVIRVHSNYPKQNLNYYSNIGSDV